MEKVQSQEEWYEEDFIQKLHQDGTAVDEESEIAESDTFAECVRTMYKSVGENAFFDDFVKKHYQRDINVWNNEKERQKELTDEKQIYNALQNVNFGLCP